MNESEAQALVRLKASQAGVRLWRNNCGGGLLANGSFVRWGLANDSEGINQVLKSADLIGIRPVLITQEHVGKTLGVFVSREVKAPGWRYNSANRREAAQMAWLRLVESLGGDAAFTTGEWE